MQVNKALAPLKFEDLSPEIFLSWCNSLRHASGEMFTFSAYNTHRAALTNLFKKYDYTPSRGFQKKLSELFKGLKRTLAKRIQEDGLRVDVGKKPLEFDLYVFLNKMLLKHSSKDFTFVRLFLLLSWNLMSRSSNTVHIKFAHLDWHEDALHIHFAHQKTTRSG